MGGATRRCRRKALARIRRSRRAREAGYSADKMRKLSASAGKNMEQAHQAMDKAHQLLMVAVGDLQRGGRQDTAKAVRSLASDLIKITGKVDFRGKQLRRGL